MEKTAELIDMLLPVQTKEVAFKMADNIRIKGQCPDWLRERLKEKPKEASGENKL
jgi:hypothetical protein